VFIVLWTIDPHVREAIGSRGPDELSLVDSVSITYARRKEIERIFGFNRDFYILRNKNDSAVSLFRF